MQHALQDEMMTDTGPITERKSDEPAGSDTLFRTVFETVPTGILLVDPANWTLLAANPAACSLSRQTPCVMVGHRITDFFHTAPATGSGITDLLQSGTSAECEMAGADGRKIPVLLIPSRSLDGKSAILVVSVIDLSDRVSEKAVLLREIHHRVKNNMQLITGMLHMEGMKIQDPSVRALFENSKHRILALAAIHEIAYRSDDFAHIPAGPLISRITSAVLSSDSGDHGNITPEIDAGDITLDIDAAVPFGILINELVSNSAMHAFPKRQNGTIEIRFRAGPDADILEYRDDGVGFPSRVDFQNPSTTGLELIRGLTGEMDGNVELLCGPGTRYRFTFPKAMVREVSS